MLTEQQDDFLTAYCALTGQSASEVVRGLLALLMLRELAQPGQHQT